MAEPYYTLEDAETYFREEAVPPAFWQPMSDSDKQLYINMASNRFDALVWIVPFNERQTRIDDVTIQGAFYEYIRFLIQSSGVLTTDLEDQSISDVLQLQDLPKVVVARIAPMLVTKSDVGVLPLGSTVVEVAPLGGGGTVPSTPGTGVSGLTRSQVQDIVREIVSDWAETDNTDNIPASKLDNAPDTGLTQSEVDDRVAAGVLDWAETGNTTQIPRNKLANAPQAAGGLNQTQVDARIDAKVQSFARDATTDVPVGKIPNAIARDSEIPTNSEIDTRVRNIVIDWAESGNTSRIPESKIPETIARDNEISDWAKAADSTAIPASKLTNAGGTSAGSFSIGTVSTLTPASGQRVLRSTFAVPTTGILAIRAEINSNNPSFENYDSQWTFVDAATLRARTRANNVRTLDYFDTVVIELINTAELFLVTMANGNLAIGSTQTDLSSVAAKIYVAQVTAATSSGGTSGLDQTAVDARVRAIVENFAEVSNNARIPSNKLPAGTLNTSDVENFAKTGNNARLPASRLPASIPAANLPSRTAAFTSALETKLDGIEAGATTDQTASEIIALLDAELGSTNWQSGGGSTGLTRSEVDARVTAGVQDWAEAGNTSVIPTAKLPARTGAFSATDESKLDNLPTITRIGSRLSLNNGVLSADVQSGGGGGLNQSQVDARVRAGVSDWAEQGNSDAIPASKLSNAPSGGLSQNQVDTRVRTIVENWAEVNNSAKVPASKVDGVGGFSISVLTQAAFDAISTKAANTIYFVTAS